MIHNNKSEGKSIYLLIGILRIKSLIIVEVVDGVEDHRTVTELFKNLCVVENIFKIILYGFTLPPYANDAMKKAIMAVCTSIIFSLTLS